MKQDPADLPVILLYNLDPTWPAADIHESMTLAHGLAHELTRLGHPLELLSLQDDRLDRLMSRYNPDEQIVLNWCEEVPGIPHSCALVAEALESLGFTYTGADPAALRFSQDKPAVKAKLDEERIPTPGWQVFEPGDTVSWDHFPAIVKPAYEHSSFGITHEAVVHDRQQLTHRIDQELNEFHQPVLVEDFIDGREFHVTIVGNGRLRVLPVAEMDFSSIREDSGRLCTFDSKFSPASPDYQNIQLKLPADLTPAEKAQLEKTALAAYKAANCRDYARLDIRETNGTFYILDINPNADISPDTSIAISAEMAGYSYAEFGSLLVKLAAHRHPILGMKERSWSRAVIPAAAMAD